MNTSDEQVDLRVRRTRKLLWEALMVEMAERAFEDITVGDICRRAMVHRTTFYKHYQDKYDLLEQGMRQMIDALLADDEHLPPGAYTPENPPPYFVRLFEHAAQHRQFYQLMLCGEGFSPFQRLVRDYIVEAALVRAHDQTPGGSSGAMQLAMHVQFVAGAAVSLLTWWLENDMPFSPVQMAQFMLSPHAMVTGPGT